MEYEHISLVSREGGERYFCDLGKTGCTFQNHETGECQWSKRCEGQLPRMGPHCR